MRRRLFLLFGAVLVVVVGAELVLRAFGWHARTPPPPFEELARRRLAGVPEFVYHPRRFYTLAPHHRAGPGHLGRYATGDWPFRGRPPEPAHADMLRVAVVGDSSMFGFGVETSLSVPALAQEHLVELGYGRDVVQVLNFGVSGYTTVQTRLCVEEVLATWEPDAVVIGGGGWNDQGPSLGVNDVEMLLGNELPWWSGSLPALARFVAARTVEPIVLPEVTPAELNEAWERGEPLFGTKVPAAHVEVAVGRAVARCVAADTPVVVVVPGHPHGTTLEHPRTVQDRDSVRRAAEGAGVPFVDGPALFAASGLSDARIHLDFGHPTPEGNDIVARALARELAAVLPPPRSAGPTPPRIVEWSPRRASCLGDVEVRLSVTQLPAGELPVVLIGGAPLLELRREGVHLTGLLAANGEGTHDLVVQSSGGCSVQPDAFVLERPRLAAVFGVPATVRVQSRPGDAAQLFWSDAARSEPQWWEAGRIWLGGTPRPPVESAAVCDAEGLLEVRLPAEAAALEELWVQARVGPRGVGPWDRISIASEPLLVPTGR